jgi:hypothetical protein
MFSALYIELEKVICSSASGRNGTDEKRYGLRHGIILVSHQITAKREGNHSGSARELSFRF